MSAKTATATLKELDAKLTEALMAVRTVGIEKARAEQEAAAAREALVEAFASGANQKTLDRLRARCDDADEFARQAWKERVAGAERAAHRLGRERDKFVIKNVNVLVQEMVPDAEKAARDVQESLLALSSSAKRWHAIAGEVVALISKVPGRDGRELPGLPVDQIAKDMRRLLAEGDIPAPLPRNTVTTAAFVVPEHDPDPDIRDEARLAMKQRAARVA